MGLQKKTIIFVLGLYSVFGVSQLISNGAMIFPTPFSNFLFFLICLIFLVFTFNKVQKIERFGIFAIFLFSAVRLIDDPYFLITFLEHEQIHHWGNSKIFALIETFGYLCLFSSIVIKAYLVKTFDKRISMIYLGLTILLLTLGFFDIPIEPIFAIAAVAVCGVILLSLHAEKIIFGLHSMVNLWIIITLLALFELWNMNL
jgi:hypothetical protein